MKTIPKIARFVTLVLGAIVMFTIARSYSNDPRSSVDAQVASPAPSPSPFLDM